MNLLSLRRSALIFTFFLGLFSCAGSSVKDEAHRQNLQIMLDGLVLKTEPESKACIAFTKELQKLATTDSNKLNKKQIQSTLDLLSKNPGASETKKEIARLIMAENKNDIKAWGFSGYIVHSGYCHPIGVWVTLQKLVETKKTIPFSKEESSMTASHGMHLVDELTSYPVRWTHLAIAISVLEDMDEAFKVGKKKSYAAEIKALKKETQELKNDAIVKIRIADNKNQKDVEDAYLEEVAASLDLRKKIRALYEEIAKK